MASDPVSTELLRTSKQSLRIMPAPLASQCQSSKQPAASASYRVSAPRSDTHTASGLAGSEADSWEQFETRCALAELHSILAGGPDARGNYLRTDFDGQYVHAIGWIDHDGGNKELVLDLRNEAKQGRRETLKQIAFSQKEFPYVATMDGRGCSADCRTVMIRDLRIFGEKFILVDHLWFKLDRKWRAIEPLFQGEKLVLVGTVVEYLRANGTTDFNLNLTKVVKLWPTKTRSSELHPVRSNAENAQAAFRETGRPTTLTANPNHEAICCPPVADEHAEKVPGPMMANGNVACTRF